MKHVIEIDESGSRHYWECSCGHSGSVSQWGIVEEAAERHIPEGEPRSHRYSGRRQR